MNRTPPINVIRSLQREVNFGCPICGIPFLTWHHFDPPYSVEEHHRLEGMIALCPNCHKQADSGLFSKKQLRQYKNNPKVSDWLTAVWPWKPEKIVFILGGSVFASAKSVLTLRGKEVLGADMVCDNNGCGVVFNMNFVDAGGQTIIEMKDNILSATTRNIRIGFTPGTKCFTFSHDSGTEIELRYKKYAVEDFQKKLGDLGLTYSGKSFAVSEGVLDSDNLIPTVEIIGKTSNPDVDLVFDKKKFTMLCKFFNNEFVTWKPKIALNKSSIKLLYDGIEIIKFG